MQIIYNNSPISPTISPNSSIYHLLLKSLETIQEPWQNLDNFYITSLEGHPLANSTPIQNDTYFLKRKCKGSSSLAKPGNSLIINIIGGLLFGFITVFYYNFYLYKVLVKIPENLQLKLDNYTSIRMTQGMSQQGGDTNMAVVAKKWWEDFKASMQDNNIKLCLCNMCSVIPEVVIKKNDSSWISTISFTIFALFIFMIIMPLMLNSTTTRICGKPGTSSVILPLIFLIIPFVLAFVSPYLLMGLDFLAKKIKKTDQSILGNYKVFITNIFLFILMFVYIILNRKGLTVIMGVMVLIGFIIFIMLKKSGIEDYLGIVNTFISNNVTNTQPVNPELEGQCGFKLAANFVPNFGKPNGIRNSPWCWMRYSIFGDILFGLLLAAIGFGLMILVYTVQVKNVCI